MTTTIDEEKSQARAVLRFAASELPKSASRRGIRRGNHVRRGGFHGSRLRLLDAIHVAEEELSAWEESHGFDDARCKSAPAGVGGDVFDEPSGSPELR